MLTKKGFEEIQLEMQNCKGFYLDLPKQVFTKVHIHSHQLTVGSAIHKPWSESLQEGYQIKESQGLGLSLGKVQYIIIRFKGKEN